MPTKTTAKDSRHSHPSSPVVETVASSGKSQQAQRMATTRIDLGDIEDLRILNEKGEIIAPELDPKLSPEELKRIHRAMVMTRKLDLRMLAMQRQGEMGTFAPGLGQEATQIGQVYPLTKRDWFSPSYRSFGAQIWRGWSMEQLMLLWDGFGEAFGPPEGVNDLPFSIVIGSHVGPATGVAMAIKARGDDAVVVVNFGDGAASQGIVAESLNFASVFGSPAVFVLENNGWAISTPTRKQAATDTLAVRGVGFGVPSIRVDGNDILAMIVATEDAVRRGRAGEGPTLIEAVTYRMSLHTTADDPKVYREDADVKAWEDKCPIRRFETYLKNTKVLDDASIAAVHDACEKEVLAARERFRERATPNARDIFDYVFDTLPPEIESQKAEYLSKLDRKGVE